MRRDSWAARALLIAGIGALVLIGTEHLARAQTRAKCTVFEINGSAKPQAKLVKGKLPKHLVKKLKRGAFAQFKHFEVIAAHRLVLSPMRQLTLKLQPGKAGLMLRGIEGGGRKLRYKLQLQLDDRSGKRLQDVTTGINEGDSLLIVDDGLKVPKGKYIFACTCKSK